ncbi:MAG: hypothetical protein ABSD68_04075 [Candidatus Micrarchaeales archaeon]|jgi:hypothetical protein
MDLLARVMISAIIVVAVLVVAYYSLQKSTLSRISEQQAIENVTLFLKRNYSNAEIAVTNVTPSQYAGSWYVVASIITNATSPCPSYFINSFDYPQFGFVPRTVNVYTSHCAIKAFSNNATLYNSPVAITRAYTLNIPEIRNFINTYGFQNVKVNAHFLNATQSAGVNYTNVWLVNYSSTSASYNIYALLYQSNGTLLGLYNISK